MTSDMTSSKRFLFRLLICFCSMIFIGAVACMILYRYAAVYEVTRPELLMDELMSSMTEEDWYNSAVQTADSYVSEFENARQIFDDFYNLSCRGKELSYRESHTSEKNKACFVVRAGNVNLYEVMLKAKEDDKPGFGRHYWRLEDIRLSDFTSSLKSVSVEVYAPEDGAVSINGVPVNSSVYAGSDLCPNMAPIEREFPAPPESSVYRIDKMFGNIRVTGRNGEEIPAEFDAESGVYRYLYVPQTYSVTIEAPEDVTVSLCGKKLAAENAVSEKNGIFAEFLDYTAGHEWKTRVYSFNDMVSEPQISAVDAEGNVLTPVITDSGRVLFFHANDEELRQRVEPSVERFFNAYMAYSSSRGRVYDLLQCTLQNSRLNSYIRYSTEGMYWASDTFVDYKELEFSNYCPVGEDCFYCTIQFQGDFSAHAWKENYSYEMRNGYEVLFVRNGKTWLAAEMSAFV